MLGTEGLLDLFQHFLRIEVPATERIQEHAPFLGVRVDADVRRGNDDRSRDPPFGIRGFQVGEYVGAW